VFVNVLDENDNTPKFSLPLYQASVPENTAINVNILRVTATDPDDGTNGLVTFSIVSGNANDTFAMDNTTGFLYVRQNIDREAVAFYSLLISASDNAPTPKSDFALVNFTVQDENDNSPIFVNVSNFTIVENSALGANVGSISATDFDTGSNGQVRYSIAKGNKDDVFQINPISGKVTVNGKIDREKMASYALTLMASDQGKPALKTEKDIYVSVDDENDNPPEFDAQEFRGLYSSRFLCLLKLNVSSFQR